jgi:alpha-1,6-mannosyltransferase
VFTNYRFMLVWSFTIFLTYSTYSNPDFQENFWLISMEYFIVFSFFTYEVFINNKVANKAVKK